MLQYEHPAYLRFFRLQINIAIRCAREIELIYSMEK